MEFNIVFITTIVTIKWAEKCIIIIINFKLNY